MSGVFISHVHEDAAKAAQLADRLRERGSTVWLDKKDLTVGDDWESEIRKAIEDGLFFVACLSQNYLSRKSTYMNREVGLAVKELAMRRPGQKWFLPVLLDPIDLRALWVGEWEHLRRIQHLRLYEDWDAEMDQLVAVIEPAAAASVQEARLREIEPPPAVVTDRPPLRPVRDIVAHRPRWRAQEYQQQAERAQESRVTSLAFDPRGGLLASCAAADEHSVRLWGVPDLNELDVTPTHEGLLSALAFSPSGEWLATAGDEPAVRIWHVETGVQRWCLPHPEDELLQGRFIPELAFNECGSLLATARGTGLHVWDLASGQELDRQPDVWSVRDLAFAPFERVVATAEGDGFGRLRDVDTGSVVLKKPSAARGFSTSRPMQQVRVSADGHLFATLTKDGECHVWQTKTGREVPELRRSDVSHVAFSRERRLMAALLADDTLRAWELDGGREVLGVEHTSEVLRLLFRPDGAMLATVGKDWRARLVDVDDASAPRILEHTALGLAFSPDSRMLATGADAIVLWGPDLS